ncbi:MAG: hypothetical protein QM730_15705 [Anaerolineales bacterium]
MSGDEREIYKSDIMQHAISVMKKYDLNLDELYDFLPYLLELKRNYRNQEKYLLADEIKKDATWLINMISYVGNVTFDEIQERLAGRVDRWTLKEFRHLDNSLLINDAAKDDLAFLLKEFNNLFPDLSLSDKDIEKMISFLNKNQITIIPFAIYYLVDIMNKSEPVWFMSMYMGLSGLLIGFESFLRELRDRKRNPKTTKRDLYNFLFELYESESWWDEFQDTKTNLEKLHAKDNLVILSNLVQDEKISRSAWVFLVVYFARNLAFHRYTYEPSFYDNLYSPIYRSISFALLHTWSCSSKNGSLLIG